MGSFKISIEPALVDIMPSFIDLTNKDMANLDVAMSSGDIEAIKKLAHTLKGDSGGYGFEEMSVISKRLEQYAESGEMDSAKAEFEILKTYWAEVQETFDAM